MPVRSWPWVTVGYGVLVTVLLAVAAVGHRVLDPTAFLVAAAALGVVALAVGVACWSPPQRAGWWLVVAGTAAVTADAGLAETFTGSPVWTAADVVAAPSLIAMYLVVITGLAMISRIRLSEVLDVVLLCLAAFVVVYTFVVHPLLPGHRVGVATSIALPLGSLLTLGFVGRAALAAVRWSVSVILLLAGVAGLVATSLLALMPAMLSGLGDLQLGSEPIWLPFGALVGSAGLHPSLRRSPFAAASEEELGFGYRVVLLVAFAVVVPLAWAVEVVRAVGGETNVTSLTIPIVASTVLLCLLVWRLVLIAQVAQRRAVELGERTDALTTAFRAQESLQRQLRYQALHDPLTGLANRLVVNERLEWILARNSATSGLAVALLDLDGFKNVNDTLGHPVGDVLLKEVSQRLLRAAPRRSTIARLGGDEFVALLEDASADEASGWAERLRCSLNAPFRIDEQDLYLSASVGLYWVPGDAPPIEVPAVLRNADLALYAAKAAGRNRVETYRPELRRQRLQFTHISGGLRRGLARNEFELYYQPVIELATRRIVAVEGLIRWTPDGEPTRSPDEFIPVAEEDGSIVAIGTWVIGAACADTKDWFETSGVTTAVNISARQLNEPGFADLVIRALADAELPGRALTIEITETTFVESAALPGVLEQIEELRRVGVGIAIDDFGTGYSSLAALATYPIDRIKIDKAFIAADQSAATWELTRAIIDLARRLKLTAIAEGVERLDQAETLRQLSCAQAQGYLFAEPMPKPLLLHRITAAAPEAIR